MIRRATAIPALMFTKPPVELTCHKPNAKPHTASGEKLGEKLSEGEGANGAARGNHGGEKCHLRRVRKERSMTMTRAGVVGEWEISLLIEGLLMCSTVRGRGEAAKDGQGYSRMV